jgi:hypothetical protein
MSYKLSNIVLSVKHFVVLSVEFMFFSAKAILPGLNIVLPIDVTFIKDYFNIKEFIFKLGTGGSHL